MKTLLLTLSMLLFTMGFTYNSQAADCQGKVINVSLNQMSWNEPTINSNGTLRVSLGTQEGELVDVFNENQGAFTGLNFSLEREDDKDLRNALIRWIFPKDLKPSQYYISFSLSSTGLEALKAQGRLKLTVVIRVAGQSRRGTFSVSSDPSWNCK